MKPTRNQIMIIAAFAISCCVLYLIGTESETSGDKVPDEKTPFVDSKDNSSKNQTSNSGRFVGNSESRRNKSTKTVSELLAMRDMASKTLAGDELFKEHRRITTLAATTLHGTDLLDYYHGLFEKGGGGIDFNWALSIGMGRVFEAGQEMDSMKWIADCGSASLQEKLCYFAGESYYGGEFDNFLGMISNPNSKSEFLAGHCAQLAINDLPQAIETFILKKPSSVDFSDLNSVFNRTPESADFKTASDLLPADDKSIAKEVRSNLLKRWASYDPEAAADFVIQSDKRVAPDQISPVLQTWFESDPGTAIDWASKIQSPEVRDLGLAAIIGLLIDRNPKQAWDLAENISNASTRDSLLKQIHRDWLKVDPKSAENARNSIMQFQE